jgi:hypothetical protein
MAENQQAGPYPWDIVTATCRCGHGVGHEAVEVEKQYGIWMQLAALLGVTPVPYEVIFHCTQCGRDFAHSTDPAIRNFYAH